MLHAPQGIGMICRTCERHAAMKLLQDKNRPRIARMDRDGKTGALLPAPIRDIRVIRGSSS
jgi:hypothetical protein